MAKYLLDTGLVLRHLRGHRRSVQFLRSLGALGRLSIATVTRLEVYAGMRSTERNATQKLLSGMATYDMDREIADRAGDLIAASRSAGKTLSVPDAIIAATAIQHNLSLVTLNKAHFAHLSGLSLHPLDEDAH